MISKRAKSKESNGEWPLQIYASLVNSLYADQRTLLLGTVGAVFAIVMTAIRTGNETLYFLSAAVTLIGLIRVVDFRVYLKAGNLAKTRAHIRRREHRYTAGASLHALLLGLWGYVCLAQTDDEVSVLISVSVIIANMVGTSGRNFALRKLVAIQTYLFSVPTLIGLMAESNPYHMVLGALLVPFFLSIISIAGNLRTNLLNAVIRERDVSMLADQFDIALNNMPHGLGLFDATGRMLVSNSLLEETFEIGLENASNTTVNSIIVDLVGAKRISMADGDRFLSIFDGVNIAKRGKLKILLDKKTTLEFAFRTMESGGTVVVFEDISERLESEEKINRMARYDSLTGLANRASFHNQIEEIMSKKTEIGEVGVMILDIDGFKQINDTLGHAVGDRLLCSVANELKEVTSSSYFVSRMGGDEFVILMPRLRCQEEASALATMIVDRLEQTFMAAGHQIFASVSVGIALNLEEKDNAESLMRNADLALNRAKSEGRGSWRFYETAMGAELEERLQLETDLRQALATDSLQVHYQPLVKVDAHKIQTCEALVRWHHPTMGPVSPARFIPIAEEMGLIIELGEYVLNKACRDCVDWPNNTRVAVNLSAIQFRSGDIVNTVETALENSGLPANRLELEITESAMLHDIHETRATLHRLRDLGVRISLDDFGTGYSSLSYLHSLPLHKVKIDRSFIIDLETNSRSLVLLKNVVKLSEDLGLSIVVEGVETEEQLNIVRQEVPRCEVQGFIFSGALPDAEIETLLAATNPGSTHQSAENVQALKLN